MNIIIVYCEYILIKTEIKERYPKIQRKYLKTVKQLVFRIYKKLQ